MYYRDDTKKLAPKDSDTLPSEREGGANSSKASSTVPTYVETRTRRVLLIEDDQRLTRLIMRVLGDEHIHADVAYDGITGLDMALGGSYDVAVIDWMLPGRDGLALCRAVRAARIPTALLLLTAREQVEDRVQGLEDGADDSLVKPFAFEELVARIRVLLRRIGQPSAETQKLRYGHASAWLVNS